MWAKVHLSRIVWACVAGGVDLVRVVWAMTDLGGLVQDRADSNGLVQAKLKREGMQDMVSLFFIMQALKRCYINL